MAGVSQARSRYYTPEALAAYGAELLRNGGNGAVAVRSLYPNDNLSNARVQQLSYGLRNTPLIKDMLARQAARAASAADAALEKYGATADRTGEELARLAFSQVRDVVDWYTVTDPKTKARKQVVRVRDASEITDDAHRAIAKVTQRPDGTITIELGDKLTALRDLARLKGWIADKPTDTGNQVAFIIQR